MNIFSSSRARLFAWVVLVFIAAVGANRPANAALVQVDAGNYYDAVFLHDSNLSMTDFKSSVAGTVTVQLTDMGWKDVLQSISVTVSRLGTAFLTRQSAGTFSFQIGKDETLSLGIYALARGPTGYGLYTLESSFAPQVAQVPLPAAGWLLVSGVGLIAGLRRRRSSTEVRC